MPLWPKRISVGTSATRIDDPDTVMQMSITVCNRGAVPVFVGGSTVTTATGYQVDPGESLALDVRPNEGGVFGVVASGTARVDRLQVGA